MDRKLKSEGANEMSRRTLLRRAGLSGLAISGITLGAGWSAAVAASDETPEAFLARAFGARIKAMNLGDAGPMRDVVDGDNRNLAKFEHERARFMRNGLGPKWDGTILGFSSTLRLVDIESSAQEVRARLYEWINVEWVQNQHPIPAEMMRRMQKDPAKYIARERKGPRGEITSGLGHPHEVVLTRDARGWRVASDAHDEVMLAGASPDLVPGSWASVRTGRVSNGLFGLDGHVAAPTSGGKLASPALPNAVYTYDGSTAASYATSHCGEFAYETSYCHWQCSQVDCANFVSQCLYAGGQATDGTWYYNTGQSCVCSNPSTGKKGTLAWVNNASLRSWIIGATAYRGVSMPSIDYCGYGDLINYDWSGDGIWDHIAIVTTPGNSSSARISCHTTDLCGVPWQAGGASAYAFTGMFLAHA